MSFYSNTYISPAGNRVIIEQTDKGDKWETKISIPKDEYNSYSARKYRFIQGLREVGIEKHNDPHYYHLDKITNTVYDKYGYIRGAFN